MRQSKIRKLGKPKDLNSTNPWKTVYFLINYTELNLANSMIS
jgi:hypothetical protein